MFFSFLKNIVFTGQEKQNIEGLVKIQCFFDHLNFVRPAKFDRNKISRQEKKHAPRFASSIWRKIFSRSAQKFRTKRGKIFFSMLKTEFRDKHKLIQKLIFSLALFSCSKLPKNMNKQQKIDQFSWQREIVFSDDRLRKFGFFTNYPTWDSSEFYSGDRANHHTHLQMKIKTVENKKISASERGWLPLKLVLYIEFQAVVRQVFYRAKKTYRAVRFCATCESNHLVLTG